MLSQHNLANEFFRGARKGQASNVSIVPLVGGQTVLVGYGHAVYAHRSASGYVTYYEGWYGYSMSTSCQISKMSLAAKADNILDKKAKLREFQRSALGK